MNALVPIKYNVLRKSTNKKKHISNLYNKVKRKNIIIKDSLY